MRAFATLLVLATLSTGCASVPSFTSVLSDPLSADARANPVSAGLEQGVSPDAQHDAVKPTTSAKVTAAANRTGRVIKCAAIGAVAGLVIAPVLMVKTGIVPADPTSWSAFALLGAAIGAAMAFKDDKDGPCG